MHVLMCNAVSDDGNENEWNYGEKSMNKEKIACINFILLIYIYGDEQCGQVFQR